MTFYIRFSLGFFAIHLVCYIIAGVIDLQLAKSIYSGKDRLFKSTFRDVENKNESSRISKIIFPSQFIRALLMSIVLYPVLNYLIQMNVWIRLMFLSGLMFVYADFASAIPFSNTIEGLVYLKKEFVERKVFWTVQFEAIIYSLLFGLLATFFLF